MDKVEKAQRRRANDLITLEHYEEAGRILDGLGGNDVTPDPETIIGKRKIAINERRIKVKRLLRLHYSVKEISFRLGVRESLIKSDIKAIKKQER